MSQPFPLFTIWQASWWKQFSRLPDLRCPMAGSSRDYFDSSQFRGVLPFLEQFVWQGGLIQYRWKGIWRHLVFMEDELVLVTPPSPHSSASPPMQLEEARTVRPLAEDDMWGYRPLRQPCPCSA